MAPYLRVYNLATGVWVRVCPSPDLVHSQISLLQYELVDAVSEGPASEAALPAPVSVKREGNQSIKRHAGSPRQAAPLSHVLLIRHRADAFRLLARAAGARADSALCSASTVCW